MFRPFFLFIGARYTNFKRPDHFITFISLISLIGISLGVMVFITVLSVMNGFTKEIRARILSITPHVTISGVWGEPLKDWQKIAEQLSHHAEVEAVGPYVDGQGMFTHGREVRGVMVKGIDPEAIEAVFPLRSTLKIGKVDDLQPGKFNVILGSQLARSLGIGVGDKITLVIPEVTVSMAGVAPRLKQLTVVGIFQVDYVPDHTFAFMNIEDAAKIFKTTGGITGLQLRLDEPFASPRISKTLQDEFEGRYNILDWTVQNATYFSAVKMEKTMMFFTILMILIIAVFNLISTLVMVVTDKRADIGVLRTLGASARKIMAIFICQGAMIGLMGTILGVILGVALALNVTDIVAAIERAFHVKFLNADVYFISYLPSDLQLSDVIKITCSAMVLSLGATIYPAWRAANLQPAEALRHES
jgi:lipoprotein-releasing system permease protein